MTVLEEIKGIQDAMDLLTRLREKLTPYDEIWRTLKSADRYLQSQLALLVQSLKGEK